MQLTQGHLLGGRVRYAQPEQGYRSGIEPVLLAAAVPARPGERVLEGGSGAGAALLCLAARVQNLDGIGLEQDPALARLAAANAAANGAVGLCFLAGRVEADVPPGIFDHAFANPPFHPGQGTASPDFGRDAARRGAPGLLAAWTAALGAPLRRLGTLSLILPAARLTEALEALAAAHCPATALLPLWPKPGRAAKLLLLQGRRFGRGPLRLLPGVVLHRPDGGFTPEAEAILRDGAGLPLAGNYGAGRMSEA